MYNLFINVFIIRCFFHFYKFIDLIYFSCSFPFIPCLGRKHRGKLAKLVKPEVEHKVEAAQKPYYCEVCDVRTRSPEAMDTHKQGMVLKGTTPHVGTQGMGGSRACFFAHRMQSTNCTARKRIQAAPRLNLGKLRNYTSRGDARDAKTVCVLFAHTTQSTHCTAQNAVRLHWDEPG